MSLQTSILCSICKKVFESEDDIFGTSCGHMYHLICLRACHTKSANCSHCSSYKPCIFKMFLEFGDTPLSYKDQEQIVLLRSELERRNEKIHELTEKCSMLQLSVQKLEGSLKKLNDALNSRNITVSDLEDRIATSETLNEFLHKELDLMIKKVGNNSRKQEPDEKNFSICKNREQASVNSRNKSSDANEHNNNYNFILAENQRLNNGNESGNSKNLNGNHSCNFEDGTGEDFIPSTINTNKLLIHNYPVHFLKKYSVEECVYYLARKMKISLPNEGIKSAINIKNKFKAATLIVDFYDIQLKNEFLNRSGNLKKLPNLKHLEMTEK